MKLRQMTGTVAVWALLTANPAFAGETEAALFGAVLGNVLGGKTELKEHAGELEGTMISSRLLMSAARVILSSEKVKDAKGLLLIGDENLDLGLSDDLQNAMDWHLESLKECAKFQEKPVKMKKAAERDSPGNMAEALTAAIGDAPAPSTSIAGYELKVPESGLVAAVQSDGIGRWVRVTDVLRIDPAKNTLAGKWIELRNQRRLANENGCGKTKKGKDRVAQFDAFSKDITSLGEDGGPSILLQAERIAQVRQAGNKVLRLKVEAAGGSVINKDNLLTRLGAPAVSISGAAIVSYRLIDPSTGVTEDSDIVVCFAPRQRLGAVSNGKLRSAENEGCLTKQSKAFAASKKV